MWKWQGPKEIPHISLHSARHDFLAIGNHRSCRTFAIFEPTSYWQVSSVFTHQALLARIQRCCFALRWWTVFLRKLCYLSPDLTSSWNITRGHFKSIQSIWNLIVKLVTCMSLSTGSNCFPAVFCFLCDKG